MNLSARNQLTGVITAIADGAINDEVELTLTSGQKLVAVVTKTSREGMGLVKGKEAIALIKAPWVVLAATDCGLKFSARNQYTGKVTAIVKGAVNDTVTLKVDDSLELVAVVTDESIGNMNLSVGDSVTALVKASSVLLAVKA